MLGQGSKGAFRGVDWLRGAGGSAQSTVQARANPPPSGARAHPDAARRACLPGLLYGPSLWERTRSGPSGAVARRGASSGL